MYLIDDIINAVGAWKAADAQKDAANQAMDLQRDVYSQQGKMYDDARGAQQPWMDAGRSTLADLLRQMQGGGFNTQLDPNQLANDPGFQFRMAQGQKALERSAAARGGLNSGGMMKSLARYSQGVASDEYQNAWNRQRMANTDRFSQMFGMAGMGQNAANTLAGIGSQQSGTMGQYANNMSSLYGALGNAEASRWRGLANAGSDYVRAQGKGFESMLGMATGGGIPGQG